MNGEVSKLLNYAYFYLRFRPRTEKEMREYLVKKSHRFHYEEMIVDRAVEDLKKQGLVDDEKFISWFVELRGSSAKKSATMLKFQLKRHGVEQDLVGRYFEANEVDEFGSAVNALRSQWRRFKTIEKRKRFEKAASFLQRKGFSYGVIKRAIAEMEGKE